MNAKEEDADALVSFQASKTGSNCPFGNDKIAFSIQPGACVALVGASGSGKTTLSSVLAGIMDPSSRVLRNQLHIQIDYCRWKESIPDKERCGVLFQQTTLLDELTVAGNLLVALGMNEERTTKRKHESKARDSSPATTTTTTEQKMKQLLDAVGLDYHRDAHKRPTELSGGMGRRASLALQLAQRKRVIVLDEPFTGLDHNTAVSIAKELVHLRQTHQTALVLISHEPHLTKLVMDDSKTDHNTIIHLSPPKTRDDTATSSNLKSKPSLFGTRFRDRFCHALVDYVIFSLPLIGMAFVACGLAIAMLSADLLARLDINDTVLDLMDKEVPPLIKLLTGTDASAFQMMGVRFKVSSMLNQTVPPAKAKLFAIGLTKLFVLEVGPLLTALLLCGRVGGSYAGRVATMQSTSQNRLLTTLGINPRSWTLWPCLLAGLIASPVLTMMGTGIALLRGGMVAPSYGVGTSALFFQDVRAAILPVLRLNSFEPYWESPLEQSLIDEGVDNGATGTTYTLMDATSKWDMRVTYSQNPTWMDTIVELATYPMVFHLLKAVVFIVVILGISETLARWNSNLTPRGVPAVITFSVVLSGLMVISIDWGFSQLWLLRE